MDSVSVSVQHFQMTRYSDYDIESMGVTPALITAAANLSRFDEALVRSENVEALCLAARRRSEACAVASLEGALVRQEALCRLLGNRELTNLDRSVRLAADAYDALTETSRWEKDFSPDERQIRGLFDIYDASSGRRLRQDLLWSLEEDCEWLRDEIASFRERPSPFEAIELLRELWVSGKFLGTSKRMAVIVAGWVLAVGFECSMAVTGLASKIATDVDSFRDASVSKVEWLEKAAVALAQIGKEGLSSINDGAASKLSMIALCPPEKSSSSIERAVLFMMENPVFTAKIFAEQLDLTSRGAKVVLDKLTETDVVEVDGGARNRTYICRRAM